MPELHTTELKFSQTGLDNRLLQALHDNNLIHCTPIQAQCLPITLSGKDVAGQAQTGTGKTATFLLSIMQHLLNKPREQQQKKQQPRAIIIAPTRELVIQIHKDAKMLNSHARLSIALVYGGIDYEKQRDNLSKDIDILIGTPGRLIDYHKQKIFTLKNVEIAVLDEADRMFDLGFIADIRYMFRRMLPPEKRQNMLFSATLSHRVNELAYEHMNNPETVIINPEHITAKNINQITYHVANNKKISLLLGLINNIKPKRTIIFVNTKRTAQKVYAYLKSNDFQADILSGDVPQSKRQRIFKEFSQGKLPVLVATDLAARGLHVQGITHIINYDLPQNAEDYVHRIGRTARAGESGDAINFACEEFVYSLMEIEQYIGYKLITEKIDNDLLFVPKPPQEIPSENTRHVRKKRSKNISHKHNTTRSRNK